MFFLILAIALDDVSVNLWEFSRTEQLRERRYVRVSCGSGFDFIETNLESGDSSGFISRTLKLGNLIWKWRILGFWSFGRFIDVAVQFDCVDAPIHIIDTGSRPGRDLAAGRQSIEDCGGPMTPARRSLLSLAEDGSCPHATNVTCARRFLGTARMCMSGETHRYWRL